MSESRFDDPLRVALLAGGDSPERDVSLRSGQAVARALAFAGHSTTTIDPARIAPAEIDWTAFDVCFIALHGGAGEDGRVQAQLDDLGVPYTGSGPHACRLAMSKHAAKERFGRCGVPTPSFALAPSDLSLEQIAHRVKRLGYPLVVKPDGGGFSLGLSIVDDEDHLTSAIAEAHRFDELAIIEPLVCGREFSVAFVDDQPLPAVEIIPHARVFSHDAKYNSAATEFRFDFGLGANGRREVMRASLGAVRAVETSGLARVDLILDDQGRAWVLEVNTVPGMTERSLAPQAAAQAGVDMPMLCNMLVRRCTRPVRVT